MQDTSYFIDDLWSWQKRGLCRINGTFMLTTLLLYDLCVNTTLSDHVLIRCRPQVLSHRLSAMDWFWAPRAHGEGSRRGAPADLSLQSPGQRTPPSCDV